MDFEFLFDGIPCCSRFETTHIAAVTKLSLCIAANDIVI